MVDQSIQIESSNDSKPENNSPISLNFTRQESGGRGRLRAPAMQQPTSWMRSASTSSLLRIKKTEHAHDRKVPHECATGTCLRSESLSRSTDVILDQDTNRFIDVLPSFEMYNALHRNIPQGNFDADRHDFPPCYQEVQTQRNSILTASENPVERTTLDIGTPTNISSTSSISLNNLHPLSTQHLNIANMATGQQDEDHMPFEDDFNDADNINIDKLYTLPKCATPIDIDIRVTKHATAPHKKPEEESMLKEYTSGDIVHGYCIVENKSPKPLKFEMFYVTLEGYISVIDRERGKRTVKRFLRMVDLSASWSYSHIDVSSGIKVTYGEVDFDDTILGLNNNRVLEPGVKYKKFFMFKLPNQLLDVTCKQEQFSHLMLPPSFGIDKYRNGCKYSGIKVNSILGCGHLGIKGSPILTSDMSEDTLSISYTIDARFVGKDKKTQKLNIMREHLYNLRVLPFGFYRPVIGERVCSQQLNDLTTLIRERLDALKLIFERLQKREPIRETDIHGTDLSGTIDDLSGLDSAEILRRKMDQLHLNNRTSTMKNVSSEKGDMISNGKARYIERELSYRLKPKGSSNLKGGLFTGFRGSHKSDGALEKSNVGLILIKAKIPDIVSLPYWSPSLLRKMNKFDAKNEHDQQNWLGLSETVPEEFRSKLSELDIRLECVQSNNSAPHEPPEIQSLTTELVCITGKSDNSIPIKLDLLTLMNESKMKDVKQTFKGFAAEIQNYSHKFHENLKELSVLYNKQRASERPLELNFADFLSPQMLNDVESLANFQTKVDVLSHVFKKQIHTLKDASADNLSAVSSSGSLHKSGSSGFLTTTFSGSSSDISKSAKFTEQLIHEWVKKGPLLYEREVKVNLEYNQNNRDTLVPNFECCLCCRFYCVRVNIKFGNHIGISSIDIPVNVKNLNFDQKV